MAVCPYCKHNNQRWLPQEIESGEKTREAPLLCDHHVYDSINAKPSGADYVHTVLHLDVHNNRNLRGKLGTEINTEVLALLNRHFTFVGGTAFAATSIRRKKARQEVCEYLHSLGYTVPEFDRS